MSERLPSIPTAPLTAERQPAPAAGRQPARRVRRDRRRGARRRACWRSSSTPSSPAAPARSASTSLHRRAPTGIGPALVGTAADRRRSRPDRDAARGPGRALPDRVRRRAARRAPIKLDAGPDERPALDHHRPLRLRPAGRRHQQSGFAGSVALAIIMLPLIARGTQEVLLLVPDSLREAADALGVSRWRTVLGVDPAERARRDRHRDRARRRPRRRRDRAADPRHLGLRHHGSRRSTRSKRCRTSR